MLTLVTHFKKVMHRVWEYFQAQLAFTMVAFNVLVQWYGLRPKTVRDRVPPRRHREKGRQGERDTT